MILPSVQTPSTSERIRRMGSAGKGIARRIGGAFGGRVGSEGEGCPFSTVRLSHADRYHSKSRPRLSWSPEEQDVAVRIASLEAAQTVVCILKRCAECCATIGKFGGKRVGVWCIDIGVPPHGGMTLGVRQRQHVFVGLDAELRSVAADDGEKRIPIRLLESRLKTKLVAVEGDGLIDVADDEEW